MKSVEVKSVFNFRVYLIPGMIMFFLIFCVVGFIDQLVKVNAGEEELKEIWITVVFIIGLTLILLHELKNKIINVKITDDNIEKGTYLGFNKAFKFKDFNGFEIRRQNGKFESYEYLYLMKDNKPIITVCQTYHENYYELKNIISSNSKYLGLSNYGLIDEVKDLLTLK